jgi:hypothetical protein
MAKIKIIEDVVPSSRVATDVTDGGFPPSFSPDPPFQCSSDTDDVLTTFTLLSSLPFLVSREQLILVVSRSTYLVFVLVVGAMLM